MTNWLPLVAMALAMVAGPPDGGASYNTGTSGPALARAAEAAASHPSEADRTQVSAPDTGFHALATVEELPAPAPPPPRQGGALISALEGAITGLATWYGGADGYGPEDTMADGSRFNPNDPSTAAANDWPLGTWLRVCYLDRCIYVQVRDRGAFGHALDLSSAAFSQLAPPSAGVISVTILSVR